MLGVLYWLVFYILIFILRIKIIVFLVLFSGNVNERCKSSVEIVKNIHKVLITFLNIVPCVFLFWQVLGILHLLVWAVSFVDVDF